MAHLYLCFSRERESVRTQSKEDNQCFTQLQFNVFTILVNSARPCDLNKVHKIFILINWFSFISCHIDCQFLFFTWLISVHHLYVQIKSNIPQHEWDFKYHVQTSTTTCSKLADINENRNTGILRINTSNKYIDIF